MPFIDVEEIKRLNKDDIDYMYKEHYNPSFNRIIKAGGFDKNFVRAEGMKVYDDEGKSYLDFIGGFGSLNLGHNPVEVQKAVQDANKRPNLFQVSRNAYAAVLAQNISFLTCQELKYCLFTNSGTEAVEEAIKLAVLYNKGGTILYFSGAYHGKTLGSISALGTEQKQDYAPFLFPFYEVPFGDIKAVEKLVEKKKIAGILIEPVQGEGGIIVPPDGYFKSLRELCDREDIILILDEIQTGLGRCGTMFCFEQFGIIPDILCVSKSLSGGIMPIGCICVKKKLWDKTYGKIKYGTYLTTTFGGNTLSCAAAIKTLSIIREKKLCERAAELGAYAKIGLNRLKNKYKIISDIRGMGLMIGIEFSLGKNIIPKIVYESVMVTIISELLKKHGIITGFTENNPSVLRMEPPLIVTKEQIDYFISCLDEVLERNNSMFKMVLNTIVEIGDNVLN